MSSSAADRRRAREEYYRETTPTTSGEGTSNDQPIHIHENDLMMSTTNSMGSNSSSHNPHPSVLSHVSEGTTETSSRSRNSGKSKSSSRSRNSSGGGSANNGYVSNDPPDEIDSHYHHRQHYNEDDEHVMSNDGYPSGSDDPEYDEEEELRTLASMDTSTFRRLREKRRKQQQRGSNNETDSRSASSSIRSSSKGSHRSDPRGGKHATSNSRNTKMRYRGRNSFDENDHYDERSTMTDGISRFSRGSHRSNNNHHYNNGYYHRPTSNQYQMGIIFALGLVLVIKAGIVEVKLENTQLRGIIGRGGEDFSHLNHLSGSSYYQKPTVVNARSLEVDEENSDVGKEDSPSETYFKDAVEKLEYGEGVVDTTVGENDEMEENDVGELSDEERGQDVGSDGHLEGDQQLQQPEAIKSETPQQFGESRQSLFVQSQQQPGGPPFQEQHQAQSQFYASSPEQSSQGVNQQGAEFIQQSQQQNLFSQQQQPPQQQNLFAQQQQQQTQPDQQQLYSQQFFNQQQVYGQQQNQFGQQQQQLSQQNYPQYPQGQPPYNHQLQSPPQNLPQQQFDPQAQSNLPQQSFAVQSGGENVSQQGQVGIVNSNVDTANLSDYSPAGNVGAVDANSIIGQNSLTDYPPPIPQPQPVDDPVGTETARSLVEANPPPLQTVDSQVGVESVQTLVEPNPQAPPQSVDNQVGVTIDLNQAVESPPSIPQPPPIDQSSTESAPAAAVESPQASPSQTVDNQIDVESVQAPVEQDPLSSDILNNRIVPFDLGSQPRFQGRIQADPQEEATENVQDAPVQVQPDAYGTVKEVKPSVEAQPTIRKEPNRDPNDPNFNFKAAVVDDGVSFTNPRLWGSKTLTTPNLRTHLSKNDAKFAPAQDSAIDQIQITV